MIFFFNISFTPSCEEVLLEGNIYIVRRDISQYPFQQETFEGCGHFFFLLFFESRQYTRLSSLLILTTHKYIIVHAYMYHCMVNSGIIVHALQLGVNFSENKMHNM